MGIKELIYRKGFTINSFCSQAQINKSTLWYYLKGKTKNLQGYTINQMAKTLKVDYSEVVKALLESRGY